MNQTAPACLSDLLQPYVLKNTLQSSSIGLLVVPKTETGLFLYVDLRTETRYLKFYEKQHLFIVLKINWHNFLYKEALQFCN